MVPSDGKLNVPSWLAQDQTPDDTLIRIWLPSRPMVAFETSDAMAVSDCIVRPESERESSRWVSPPEVWTPGTRVTEFGVLPGEAESFLERMQESMGQELGRIPGDDKSGESIKSRLSRSFLEAMQRMLPGPKDGSQDPNSEGSQIGKGNGDANTGRSRQATGLQGSGLLGRSIQGAIGAISAPLVAAMAMAMRNQRGDQIDRLMKLFESDPDKALQYAIPMGGDSSWRGFSIPGFRIDASE